MAEKNNYYGSGIFVAGNIDIGAIGKPADSRVMVPNLDGLAELVADKRVYDGMIVYCESTKTYHKCSVEWDSSMNITSSSWKQVEIQSLEELKALIAQESTAAMEFKGTIKNGTLPTLEEGVNYDGNLYKIATNNVTIPAALNAEGGEEDVIAKPGDSIVCENGKWYLIPSGDDIEDTWRAIKVNGVEKFSNGTTSNAVDFAQGENVTISEAGGVITIAAADTHYESKLVAANSATDATDEAAEAGQVHLNLVEDGVVRSSHKIVGAGGITVTHALAEGEDGVNTITIEAPEGAKYDLAAKTENNEAILSLAGTDNTEDKVAIIGNDAVAVIVEGGKIKVSAHDTKYTGSEGEEIKVGATNDGAIAAELTETVRTKLNKVWEEVGVAAGLIDDFKNDYVGTFTHDTAKTVVDYINAKTDGIATSGNLEALGQRVTAVENDIKNNRDAWAKDDNDNTTYQFSIPTSGDDKGKLLVEKKEIGETAWTRVDAYDVTTPDELAAALAAYYTNEEIDGIVDEINGKIDGIDTGVHAVALAGGTNSGTLKLTVDGNDFDNIAVTGLQDAAYATVESLNATAKGYADAVEAKLPTSADYGVLGVTASDDTITIGGDAQNPTIAVTANKFDAYGAAAQALADAKAYADEKPHENTAHTHSAGDGLKKTGDGTIDGDVKYELNVAMKLEDGDIVIYDKDNNNEVAKLDAAELLEDSYLNDVEIVGNKLQFTWKMDNGTTKTDSVDLKHLVDVYSGDENDYIKVTVDNYKITAELLKVDTAIIEDGAITYDKLEDELRERIDYAESLQLSISIETDPSTVPEPYLTFYEGDTYIGTSEDEDNIVATQGDVKAVEAKIPTELGVMSIANGDDTITVGGTAKDLTIAVTAGAIGATQLSENINTAIGQGTEAYGWGNHANAGYIRNGDHGTVMRLSVQEEEYDTSIQFLPGYPFNGSGDAAPTIEFKKGKYPDDEYATRLQINPEVTENVYATLPAESGVLALTSEVAEALNEAKLEVAALAGEGNTTTVKAVADRVKELEDANHISNVEADTGLKVVAGTNGANNKVAIDESVVFILDCNW